MSEKPIFVKIDKYKEVVDILHLVRDKINEAEDTLEKIYRLKDDEDKELEDWRLSLEEIEKKVDTLGRTLVEPEEM